MTMTWDRVVGIEQKGDDGCCLFVCFEEEVSGIVHSVEKKRRERGE